MGGTGAGKLEIELHCALRVLVGYIHTQWAFGNFAHASTISDDSEVASVYVDRMR